jgi:hypothetical protein
MKTCSVGAELLHAEGGRTDGHEEAMRHFSQFRDSA